MLLYIYIYQMVEYQKAVKTCMVLSWFYTKNQVHVLEDRVLYQGCCNALSYISILHSFKWYIFATNLIILSKQCKKKMYFAECQSRS